MIGAASLALQILGLLLLLALAVAALTGVRRIAARMSEHIDQLEEKLKVLESRSTADAAAIAELQARLPSIPAVTSASSPSPTPLPTMAAELPGELVALLTAAAYAAIGKPVVLHYALVIGEDQGGAWRTAGRADIFASHRIR